MDFKNWLQQNEVFGGTFRKVLKWTGLDSTTVYDDLARMDEELPSIYDLLDQVYSKLVQVHGQRMADRYQRYFIQCWSHVKEAIRIIRSVRADPGIGEKPYNRGWVGNTTINYDLTELAYAINAWYDLLDSIIHYLDTQAGAPPEMILGTENNGLHLALKHLDAAINEIVTVWKHFQPTDEEAMQAMKRTAHIMPPNVKRKQYKQPKSQNYKPPTLAQTFGWKTRYSTKPSKPFAPSSFNPKKWR